MNQKTMQKKVKSVEHDASKTCLKKEQPHCLIKEINNVIIEIKCCNVTYLYNEYSSKIKVSLIECG